MFRVLVDIGEGYWCGNAQRHETVQAAREAAEDLFSRWMAVRDWAVVPVEMEADRGPFRCSHELVAAHAVARMVYGEG